ncbi:hypothetical protein D9615_001984 [Tricholomella constricta]|uniref:Zn(2)-C6 fungal-type domain-containing protein n=1 Tax=Tricholomella constricta TaxID=117010 RepID=A0A8H5HNY4_9AGAR|nr:hypothetical protein D9615_001984 [Tricholomella constricta]
MLSKRKRKLKCDGNRPVCHQCSKMNRGHTCEYDDKQQKSRTQQLKEQLSQLESRLQELESSSSSSSSSSSGAPSPPFHFDFETYGFDDAQIASPSNYPLFNFASVSTTPSPPPSDSGSAKQSIPFQDGELFGLHSDNSAPSSTPNSVLGEPSHQDPRISLPPRAKQYLLDVFMTHRHQCWFYANMDRFLDCSQNQSEPHPALINAMYLLACHFAHTPLYSEMEPAFFVQAQHEINAALDSSDRLTDIVQASSLLAVYLYMNNRVMEGYRHTFSAIRLAVGLGLHQIRTPTAMPGAYPPQAPPIPISPPRDDTELNDRIFAFWQVFMVDRCWSVAHGLPLALPDKDTAQCRILTPWPSTGESSNWQSSGLLQPPLQTLFEGLDFSEGPEPFFPALKAKAAALYELTARSRNSANRTDWSYSFAEAALQCFSSTIPTLRYDRDYFMVQTLVYASFIHLQRHVLFDGRALKAGHSIVRLICQLTDADWQHLDPIISVCWLTAAEMFTRAVTSAKVDTYPGDVSSIISACINGLDVITHALQTFRAYSPLSGDLALKVEFQLAHS